MNDDQPTTVSWVSPTTAELIEAELTPDQAERLEQGKPVSFRGELRRYSNRDTRTSIGALVDQVETTMDEMVTEYPQLKSRSSRKGLDERARGRGAGQNR